MTVYLGLLRAVNLGGHSQVRMPALSEVIRGMGFEDVRTLLQSGNVILRGPAQDTSELERALEREASDKLGLSTDFFVRTASEWRKIIEQNPFPRAAVQDPAHLVVMALKRSPARSEWAGLRAAIRGREKVEGIDRHAYIVYPDGIGRSKLTAVLIERQLRSRGTSRNWNTVLKLDQLAVS
jgi:uncharacterized protein (DUF1697 family)